MANRDWSGRDVAYNRENNGTTMQRTNSFWQKQDTGCRPCRGAGLGRRRHRQLQLQQSPQPRWPHPLQLHRSSLHPGRRRDEGTERLLIIQPGSDARFNETTHQHVTYSPTFHPFLILCSANPVSPSSRFLGFGIFRNASMSRGTNVSFVVVWSMPSVQQASDVIIVAMTSRSKIDRSRTSISRWEFLQFFFLTESVDFRLVRRSWMFA